MGIFQKKVRKSEKMPKKEKIKKYRVGRIQVIVWFGIFLFIGTGISSIASGFQAKTQAMQSYEAIESLKNEINDLKNMSEVDTPEADSFFRRFLNTYFTVNKEMEAQEKRVENLKVFSKAFDYQLPNTPTVGQAVSNITHYGYQKLDDYFLVTYTVETKTDEKEPQKFKYKVSIPFKKEKDGYVILALPYQLEYDLNGSVSEKTETLTAYQGELLKDEAVKEELQTFAEQFLTEYEANNKENLKYLMSDVEGLGNGKTIKLKKITYYGSQEAPVLELNITVNDADTDIGFAENIRLHLVKNADGKYFVETLDHY